MFICPTERYSLFADDWVRLRGQNSKRGAATPVLQTAGSEGKRPRISINATHFRSSSPNQYDHYAGVWQRNPAVWLTAAFFIKSLLSCFIGFLDGPHSSVESVTKTNIIGNWRGGGVQGHLTTCFPALWRHLLLRQRRSICSYKHSLSVFPHVVRCEIF